LCIGPNTNEQVKQHLQKKRATFATELQLLFSTEDVFMEVGKWSY